MDEPIISIIVPIYNVEQYLHKCVNSILEQEFTKFELILVDDGSQDNSGEICDEYANKDNRIRVSHKRNGGVSSARNVGLEMAQGSYIVFVDSDDYVNKDIYTVTLPEILSSAGDLCIYGYRSISKKKADEYIPPETKTYNNYNEIVHEIIVPMLFGTRNNLVSNPKRFLSYDVWSAIFKKDIIKNNNLRFDETIGRAEDLLFYSRYLIECKKVICIEKALYNYVQREQSATHSYKKPSDYGFDRSIYIYSTLERNLKLGNINEDLYQDKLVEKFIGIIIGNAKSICDSRNKERFDKVYKTVRSRCMDSRLAIYLEYKNIKQLRPLIRITSFLARHEMILSIIILAKLLNIREQNSLFSRS